MTEKTLLFVTGRLAEGSLRDVLQTVAPLAGFRFEVTVPGIQVAALLHTGLLKRRLTVPDHIDQVIVPGWCQGELAELEVQFGRPFAVLVGNLGLGATERLGDRVLEIREFQVVRHAVHRDHAGDPLGMEGGERQRGRSPHRSAADDHLADPVAGLHLVENLQHVRLRPGSHP